MAKGSLPTRDRAALSARARDHLHGRTTAFHAADYLSMATDLLVGFGALVILWLGTACSAFGLLRHGALLPETLCGPDKWEAALWTLLSLTAAAGLWGLLQFWLRRIWEKTYATKASLWNGALASQLVLGAVMPGVCVLMLVQDGQMMAPLTVLFALAALLYARHGLQVLAWARR